MGSEMCIRDSHNIVKVVYSYFDIVMTTFMINNRPTSFQGLSSLPPLVVGTETLVAAGHVFTQNLGGRKICWKGGATGFFYCHSDKFT